MKKDSKEITIHGTCWYWNQFTTDKSSFFKSNNGFEKRFLWMMFIHGRIGSVWKFQAGELRNSLIFFIETLLYFYFRVEKSKYILFSPCSFGAFTKYFIALCATVWINSTFSSTNTYFYVHLPVFLMFFVSH